jgi:CspA family cold shock protein
MYIIIMDSNSENVSSSTVLPSHERFIGRVKWFNNKAGYGFITVTDGSRSGSDIFVHHSSIKVDSEQYKYLVQGEYLEFSLSETKTETHEFQAGEVSGINGGKLMCETRRDLRSSRNQYKTVKPNDNETINEPIISMPRSVAPPLNKSNKTRLEDDNWTSVKKNKKPQRRPL